MINENERLLRIKEVLKRIPVSKSTWWAGVKSGIFPEPIHLGTRVTCWLESDIISLMDRKNENFQ
jgi:prophage regulatory protein